MKHFIYAIASKTQRGKGYRKFHLKLWQIIKGKPVHVANYRYTFESPDQAALNAIIMYGPWSKAQKQRAEHPMGGLDVTYMATLCTWTNVTHTEVT